MKRIFGLFTAAVILLSFAACGKEETVETESAKIETKTTTYTGTVSAVSTDSLAVFTEDGDVTVVLTDATTFQREIGAMGEMPNDGETPPDKPEVQQGEPMDKPDGGMGNQPDGTPPEMPNGQQHGEGDVPEKPDSNKDMGMSMPEITASDISVGDTVTVKTDGNGSALSVILSGGEMGMGGLDGMQFGMDS